MENKKFETLTDWNEFMKGRSVLVINQNHSWKNEKCVFVEMIGANEKLNHPANKGGKNIQMKVTTRFGTELMLEAGDFMVIEKEIIQQPNEN